MLQMMKRSYQAFDGMMQMGTHSDPEKRVLVKPERANA
jgi:hypothetical protein